MKRIYLSSLLLLGSVISHRRMDPAYDFIKAYGGELGVETKDGQGTTFVIQ